jgi:tyrosyl-tRNA synthetase
MSLFGKKNMIDTNTTQIDEFLIRGVENVFPSREAFKKALSSGKRLSIYLGIDPTGPTLHMGHAIPLMKLSALQKMGHKVILLMGDFTAMIGDPTDKAATRKVLTRDEVLENLKLYKKQASKFLSFSGSNAAEFKFNSKWLGAMSFGDVISLASQMTVQQMLERDMFEKRLEEKKPISIHEFLYPLMQGYDSVAMDVDAEVGGNDQTFNMLTGRDLMRSMKNKEKFVISTKLLVDPSGKKMGKSEGNMITMLDSAENMFGKVMSWPDGLIISGFELCTRNSKEEIEKEKAALDSGANPRDSKIRLAAAVVEVYHGKEAAQKAKESFVSAFSQGTMKSDAPAAEAVKGTLLVDVLIAQKIVASKTEWRRLVSEKAVKDMGTGSVIEAFDLKVEKDVDLKVGKHRFIKIKAK